MCKERLECILAVYCGMVNVWRLTERSLRALLAVNDEPSTKARVRLCKCFVRQMPSASQLWVREELQNVD